MNNLEKLKEKAKFQLEILNTILGDIEETDGKLTVGLILAYIKGRKEGLEKVIEWGNENA